MELKSKTKNSIAIVIPMYNEESGAKDCIKHVTSEIKKASIPMKLIIVNDGSTDSTQKVINESLQDDAPPISVCHLQNLGYGAALRTGIQAAVSQDYEWCLFMDSDLTNPPRYIHSFIDKIAPNVDCVKASRFVPGGGMENVPLFRRINTYLGNLIARSCFRMGIKDCTNGFRMVRTNLLQNIPYQERSFAIILEELFYLKKMSAHCVEFPNILTSRIETESSFRYSVPTYWSYLKYALKASTI